MLAIWMSGYIWEFIRQIAPLFSGLVKKDVRIKLFEIDSRPNWWVWTITVESRAAGSKPYIANMWSENQQYTQKHIMTKSQGKIGYF